ncbi:tellurite resistance protein TrgA [Rhodobacter sp.]
MPTTAKLVAAVLFALIGWLAANAHVPALGEGAAVGRFRELTALIGVIVGWRTMGSLVGGSYSDAIGAGLRTSATLVFFALLLFSTWLMYGQTEKMAYDGPMDAVLGVFDFMLEHARKMLTPGVLGVLVVGGALAGVLTESAARRWR